MEGKSIKSKTGKIQSMKAPILKTKVIKQKEFIHAKPVEIYDALLNEQTHSEFTGAKATCDRRVGGKFTAWDGYIQGKNIKLENGEHIVQEWKTSEWPKGFSPSLLELKLKPKGEGTVVELIQKNVPATQADEYKQGWTDFYWNPLKRYFGHKQ